MIFGEVGFTSIFHDYGFHLKVFTPKNKKSYLIYSYKAAREQKKPAQTPKFPIGHPLRPYFNSVIPVPPPGEIYR